MRLPAAALLACGWLTIAAFATAQTATSLAPPKPAPAAKPALAQPTAVADIEAQLAFLRTASVVSSRKIGKGVTGALRVTLRDGAKTHDAAFQAVASQSSGTSLQQSTRRTGAFLFVDHYRYNIAAWQLARLLGLAAMMPPTVERQIDGRTGALAWWVDDVLMDEEARQKSNALPPGGSIELAQMFGRMYVFAALVRDTDRNQGNAVFTTDWRLVMLDFTRAFRLQHELLKAEDLGAIDRRLFAALRALTVDQVEAGVEHWLTSGEVEAVMARRDLLVQHFERRIALRGEAGVLY
ncbi:MAG: hypothetical protein ABI880_02490 [Acidobacteriota bacterium]